MFRPESLTEWSPVGDVAPPVPQSHQRLHGQVNIRHMLPGQQTAVETEIPFL
jgi:hypothetical protein